MQSLRRLAWSRDLVYLVSMVMVVQGLMPVAAHTTLARDSRGDLVQVCTLRALQTRTVDANGHLSPGAPAGDDQGPAVRFSQLVAECLHGVVTVDARPPVFPPPSAWGLPAAAPAAPRAGLRPIRGPPLS